MADKKPKSRKPFRQDKYPVYQALARINQAFEVIETEFLALQNSGVVPSEPVNIYRTKELRAGINHRIVDLLKDRELMDWTIWQKHRMIRERVLVRKRAIPEPKRRATKQQKSRIKT